jgi:hypothetical protein
MGRLTVLALRAVLAMLLVGSVYVQIVIVAINVQELDADLEDLSSPWLVITVVVLGLVTVEVIGVCVWRLVTMARRGTVFSHEAFRYVDVVIGAIVAAAVLMVTLAVLLTSGDDVSPGTILVMAGAVVAVLGIALIVLVLRMLLARAVARDVEAAQMRAELDEVI